MKKSVYHDTQFLFHQFISEDEYKQDLDMRIEDAVFKYYEIQKQKPKINKED